MDPRANLQEQRELAAKILAIVDAADELGDHTPDQEQDLIAAANRLAELVQALDEWRTHGGYDPYTGGE